MRWQIVILLVAAFLLCYVGDAYCPLAPVQPDRPFSLPVPVVPMPLEVPGCPGCPVCNMVCTLWSPHHHHCFHRGVDPICQSKHDICMAQVKRRLDCVVRTLRAVDGVAGACASCVGSTEGAGLAACAEACAATPNEMALAGQMCGPC